MLKAGIALLVLNLDLKLSLSFYERLQFNMNEMAQKTASVHGIKLGKMYPKLAFIRIG